MNKYGFYFDLPYDIVRGNEVYRYFFTEDDVMLFTYVNQALESQMPASEAGLTTVYSNHRCLLVSRFDADGVTPVDYMEIIFSDDGMSFDWNGETGTFGGALFGNYNGVELPAYPEGLLNEFPYAVIINSVYCHFLITTWSPMKVENGELIIDSYHVAFSEARDNNGAVYWGYVNDSGDYITIPLGGEYQVEIIHSNFDVPGQPVIFSATDIVPGTNIVLFNGMPFPAPPAELLAEYPYFIIDSWGEWYLGMFSDIPYGHMADDGYALFGNGIHTIGLKLQGDTWVAEAEWQLTNHNVTDYMCYYLGGSPFVSFDVKDGSPTATKLYMEAGTIVTLPAIPDNALNGTPYCFIREHTVDGVALTQLVVSENPLYYSNGYLNFIESCLYLTYTLTDGVWKISDTATGDGGYLAENIICVNHTVLDGLPGSDKVYIEATAVNYFYVTGPVPAPIVEYYYYANYYYPRIPELEDYPYRAICWNNSMSPNTVLVYSKNGLYYSEPALHDANNANLKLYGYENEQWVELTNITPSSSFVYRTKPAGQTYWSGNINWASHDIMNGSMTSTSLWVRRTIPRPAEAGRQVVQYKNSRWMYFSGSSYSITVPSCVVGDVLLMAYTRQDDSNTTTLPEGWIHLGGGNKVSGSSSSSNVRLYFAYKPITVAGTETILMSQTKSVRCNVIIAHLRGVATLTMRDDLAKRNTSNYTVTGRKSNKYDIMFYGVATSNYTSGSKQYTIPDDMNKVPGPTDKEYIAGWLDAGCGALEHSFVSDYGGSYTSPGVILEAVQLGTISQCFGWANPVEVQYDKWCGRFPFSIRTTTSEALKMTLMEFTIGNETLFMPCVDAYWDVADEYGELTFVGYNSTYGTLRITANLDYEMRIAKIEANRNTNNFTDISTQFADTIFKVWLLTSCVGEELPDTFKMRDRIQVTVGKRAVMPENWLSGMGTEWMYRAFATAYVGNKTVNLSCCDVIDVGADDYELTFVGYYGEYGFIRATARVRDLCVEITRIQANRNTSTFTDVTSTFAGSTVYLQFLEPSVDTSSVLEIDFTNPSWRTLRPDIYTVTDSNGFYTASTFQYNGKDTLRSYGIGNSGVSQTTITFNMTSRGRVEFNCKVSSETNYDILSVIIDNTTVASISGQVDWTDYARELSSGQHTITFKYSKDSSQYSGSDAGAIGYLRIGGVGTPYVTRYLVRSQNSLYAIVSGSLQLIPTNEVSALTFREFGGTESPSSELLMSLVNPEMLMWSSSYDFDPQVMAVLSALPYPQTVESPDYDMTDETVLGIEKVTAVASDNVQFAVSFNSGVTWMTFIEGVWAELSENASGMTTLTLNAIPTDKWNELATTGKFRFRVSLMDWTSEFYSLIVDYLNEVDDT